MIPSKIPRFIQGLTFAAAWAFSLAVQAEAVSSTIAGRDLAKSCLGCHGQDGNGTQGGAPRLAGQYAQYLAKQIIDYRDGRRLGHPAGNIGPDVSDEAAQQIGSYFAAQPRRPARRQGSEPAAELAAQGERLYNEGNPATGLRACATCHGERGLGKSPNIALFPVVAGQPHGYTVSEVNRFRERARGNDVAGMMGNAVKPITDDEVQAVAAYLARLTTEAEKVSAASEVPPALKQSPGPDAAMVVNPGSPVASAKVSPAPTLSSPAPVAATPVPPPVATRPEVKPAPVSQAKSSPPTSKDAVRPAPVAAPGAPPKMPETPAKPKEPAAAAPATVASATPPPAPAGPPGRVEAGRRKAVACEVCHGANGRSANPDYPVLAGQHAGYIVRQLQSFQSGARRDAVMNGMAQPLSRADMEEVAAYFSAQRGLRR